jgi:hypothetical protein
MEPAIHDLTRELDTPARILVPELDVVELEVVDELLLDPWFWRSEEEFAEIKDDPTAKIIEIKIGKLAIDDYGTGFDDSRWAF